MTTAIALALAVAWAAAVTGVASPARHHARRRLTGAMERPLAAGQALGPSPPRSGGPVGALGAWVRRATGLGPPDTTADRRIGWAAVAGLALVPMAAPLAPVPVLWALLAPVLRGRAAERRREAAVVDQVPDLVDLLALTTAAGLPVGVALTTIGDRPGGPAGAAVARAEAYIERGGSTAGALDHLAALGPAARPLVDALAQHDRYGTPLLPALQRVAIETRARRRRRAEEAARRLPVTLLLPLVLTTLPAFVLLTVVPLLAGSLTALSG